MRDTNQLSFSLICVQGPAKLPSFSRRVDPSAGGAAEGRRTTLHRVAVVQGRAEGRVGGQNSRIEGGCWRMLQDGRDVPPERGDRPVCQELVEDQGEGASGASCRVQRSGGESQPTRG